MPYSSDDYFEASLRSSTGPPMAIEEKIHRRNIYEANKRDKANMEKARETFNDKMVDVFVELTGEISVILDEAVQKETDNDTLSKDIAKHAIQKFKTALKEYIER
jgi:hypothetical protein